MTAERPIIETWILAALEQTDTLTPTELRSASSSRARPTRRSSGWLIADGSEDQSSAGLADATEPVLAADDAGFVPDADDDGMSA